MPRHGRTLRCVRWGFVLSFAVLAGCGSSHVTGDPSEDRDGASTASRDGAPAGGESDSSVLPRSDGGWILLPDGAVIPPPTDAGVARDGGGPGPTTGGVGTPCHTSEDCDGRFCVAGSGLGYCSWVCAPDIPCPDGAVCAYTTSTGVGYCLAACDASGACGSGLVCTDAVGTAEPVCIAGCSTDADCPAATLCGPGFSPGVGRCYTPTVVDGAPCDAQADCSLTQFCADEITWGFPHGTCIAYGCDETTGTGCSATTACVPSRPGEGGVCMPRCSTDSDCRAGYACLSGVREGDRVCLPRCRSSDVCSDGRVCEFLSGLCLGS